MTTKWSFNWSFWRSVSSSLSIKQIICLRILRRVQTHLPRPPRRHRYLFGRRSIEDPLRWTSFTPTGVSWSDETGRVDWDLSRLFGFTDQLYLPFTLRVVKISSSSRPQMLFVSLTLTLFWQFLTRWTFNFASRDIYYFFSPSLHCDATVKNVQRHSCHGPSWRCVFEGGDWSSVAPLNALQLKNDQLEITPPRRCLIHWSQTHLFSWRSL